VARSVAPAVAEHLRFHRAALPPQDPAQPPLERDSVAARCRALIELLEMKMRAPRAGGWDGGAVP
jgi:hypothetical protein